MFPIGKLICLFQHDPRGEDHSLCCHVIGFDFCINREATGCRGLTKGHGRPFCQTQAEIKTNHSIKAARAAFSLVTFSWPVQEKVTCRRATPDIKIQPSRSDSKPKNHSPRLRHHQIKHHHQPQKRRYTQPKPEPCITIILIWQGRIVIYSMHGHIPHPDL